jgi:protein-disulfide isomerase
MLVATAGLARSGPAMKPTRGTPPTNTGTHMQPIRTALGTALALGLSLTAPAAGALDLDDLTDAQREAFRAEVRAYLLDNPEVLIEAINRLEERQAAAQAGDDSDLIAVNAEALFEDGHSYVGGNPEGDVTLVEFLDYSCGFCKQAHPEVMELLETDGNIRFIVKEFPILGPGSELASRFAISVLQIEGDAAYAEVMDRLMALRGAFERATLERLAADMGLDMAALSERMESGEVGRIIDENRALAARLQINGTPTFVLGDRMLRGYLPLPSMEMLVAEARGE